MKNMFKRWMENFKKDERGMTLVELLAVIVILAIVGVIAFVSIGNVIENSRQDAHIANATQIISAAELEVATGADPSEIEGVSDLEETMSNEIVPPWDNEGDSETYAGNFELSYDEVTEGTGEDANTEYKFTITFDGAGDNCDFTEEKSKVDLGEEGRDICG